MLTQAAHTKPIQSGWRFMAKLVIGYFKNDRFRTCQDCVDTS